MYTVQELGTTFALLLEVRQALLLYVSKNMVYLHACRHPCMYVCMYVISVRLSVCLCFHPHIHHPTIFHPPYKHPSISSSVYHNLGQYSTFLKTMIIKLCGAWPSHSPLYRGPEHNSNAYFSLRREGCVWGGRCMVHGIHVYLFRKKWICEFSLSIRFHKPLIPLKNRIVKAY